MFGADGAPYNMESGPSVGKVGSCSMVDIPYECGGDEGGKGSKHDFQPLISHSSVFLLVSSFVRIKIVQISAVSGSVHEMASDNGKLTEKFHVGWDRNSTNQNHYVFIIYLYLFLWTILTTPIVSCSSYQAPVQQVLARTCMA